MIWRKLRNWFLAGVVVLLPVWLTLFTVSWLFQNVDDAITKPLTDYFGRPLPGLGLVIALVLFLLVGWLTTHLLGQELIRVGDGLMLRIPVVRALYSAVKQMTETVLTPREQSFSGVVLVEYPREGVYSVGFAAGPLPGVGLVRVWIPPGPSPTAGPVVLFPTEAVIQLPMPVEDGFKLIVSAGSFTPRESDIEAIGRAVKDLTDRRRQRAGA